MNSQAVRWKNFFTNFKDYAREVESAQIPAMDAKAAEPFFKLFRQHYAPFVKSGGTINVWDVAGISTDEVRNCAVLGWLLDCHGSHGQGAAFLHCFLESLQTAPGKDGGVENLPQAGQILAPYRTTLENTYAHECQGDNGPDSRVDIVIENDSFLLFVEVKIYAGDTGDQLKRYADILNARACGRACGLVLLTPSGRPPQDESAKDVTLLSWRHLAAHFEAYADSSQRASVEPCPPLWAELVRQFCQHINTF
ncbi:PD-(D/E)XK nuclease family protein [Desulfovibrio sp. OttesenSCG-928-M14]|nr:PD-(D/E)XK nuclease family protein [Desulfovibrio sp. OttesenSCG-928-M14]